MNSVALEIGLCLGLVLMAFALFQSHRGWVRRVGGFVLVGTSGVVLWFWTQNWVVAGVGVSMWVVLPVVQAAYLSRCLRFSIRRKLTLSSDSHDEFPDVMEISSLVRKQGFVASGDYWLEPSPIEQGYRVFVNERDGVYGAIALVKQGPAVLSYLIFASRDKSGTMWLTWDYPLAYGLHMPPELMIHRCLEADSVEELYRLHLDFLVLNDVEVGKVSCEAAAGFFDGLFKSMIDYNIRRGVLRVPKGSTEEINYTWRGTVFVSWQVFREVVFG